jgi:hypothetical protein
MDPLILYVDLVGFPLHQTSTTFFCTRTVFIMATETSFCCSILCYLVLVSIGLCFENSPLHYSRTHV